MPTSAPAGAGADPAATWKALAHLIAARPAIRTWNPATNKFDRSRPLTSRLPRVPAAVLLYLRGRTKCWRWTSTPNATVRTPSTPTSPAR